MEGMYSGFGSPINVPEAPKKTGMFGAGAGKPDWASALQALIGGALASRGNPGGAFLLNMLNQKRQMAMEAQQHQQERDEGFEDFVRKEAYKSAHTPPAVPDIVERINALNNLEQGLGNTYAKNYAQSGGSPFGPMFTDPATGQRYMMGGGQQGLPPIGSVVADPRKQGGPMPSASGGFPPFGY